MSKLIVVALLACTLAACATICKVPVISPLCATPTPVAAP